MTVRENGFSHVYFLNQLEKAELTANSVSQGYSLSALYSDVISEKVAFNAPSVGIIANFRVASIDSTQGLSPGVIADSVVIGFTNATDGHITVYGIDNKLILSKDIEFREDEDFSMFHFITQIVTRVDISLSTSTLTDIDICYLYVGKVIELPIHGVDPTFSLDSDSQTERSPTGHVYGIAMPVLKTIEVSFPAITEDEKDLFMAYFNAVNKIIPHLIDIYPEAHNILQPMFGVITGGMEFERNTSQNFYSVDVEWQESS